ncbi:siderophore-interacting protein [Amorphus sp. 3PC139-8]|uniref:siderophore-interacting protein n=1 Tax=Amorphus sp. 3PC139-8 TaxID=2735676 RepID=UPI00345DD18D
MGMRGSAFHQVELVARRNLSAGMVRLTLSGDLSAFRATGVSDEYLRLFFPCEETGEVVLPIIDAEGRWSYRTDKPPVRCATYTVRRFDPTVHEIDIDFVIHEGGLASEWAQCADIGSPMIINNPRGLYAPPAGTRHQLLLADATGLPALSRILEETPSDVRSEIFVEVEGPDHKIELPAHPGAEVTWNCGECRRSTAAMLDYVRTRRGPDIPDYVWAAGEQRPIRALRKHVRSVFKLPTDRHKLVAYWIDDPTRMRRPATAAQRSGTEMAASSA